MYDTLKETKKKVYLSIVGGSDLIKQQEQLGGTKYGNITQFFDYVFSENGLVAYHDGESINDHSLKKELTEEEIQKFINYCLHYIADLEIPIKRGTFVEFRTGMINISPIGRNCNQNERKDFYEYDKKHKIRETMISEIYKNIPQVANKLKCSIGGEISFDVFPIGWDKTYCLRFIENKFKEIHFFGDKTSIGGNDYEIYHDKRVIGHTVTSPNDTVKLIKEIISKLNNNND